MKKYFTYILILSMALFCSCGSGKTTYKREVVTKTAEPQRTSEPGEIKTDIDSGELEFSNKDRKTDYDETGAALIALSDGYTSYKIETAGDYVISGSCANGSIIIEATKEDKIHIILDGVSLTSAGNPCLNVICADKVFVTLKEGSENYFTMTGESEKDGAVFSKDDITFNGSGKLTVSSSQNGLVGKDELIITGGTYEIDTKGHGLQGKDCVKVQNGTLAVRSGSDGIHAGNDTDTAGFVFIEGGHFTIEASGDGIDAAGECIIAGGEFDIKTGSGASSSSSSGRSYSSYGRNVTSTSTKAIKSSVRVSVSDGVININSCDDGIHSDGDTDITGGTLTVAATDDAIHSNDATSVSGGRITITKSYEGIEGHQVYISGGEISLVSSDDGINAAGKTESSSQGGRGGWGGPGGFGGGDSEALISISGGKIFVNADGDGVDSNGDLMMSGGELYVSGPTRSDNGALDYEYNATITGGIVIACGSTGMDETFGTESTQGVIRIRQSGKAGNTVTVRDSNGNVLASYTPEKNFGSVVISHPDIVKGKTYTVSIGSSDTKIEMTSLNYGGGSSGGPGGPGGPGGQRRPGW